MPEPDYTNAEVVRSLQRIEKDVSEVKAEMRQQIAGYVPRGEFDTWKAGIGREIGEIRTSMTASRVSWPQVATVVVSVATLAVTLMVLLGRTPG